MTWSELVTKVYRILGENSGSSHWSTDQIDALLKESELELIGDLKINPTNSLQSIVAGTYLYTIPTGWQRIIMVACGDEEVIPATEKELTDIYGAEWSSETGAPQYYFMTPTQIRLVPIPSESETNGLRIDYHASPTQTNPTLDAKFKNCLAYKAAYEALLEDGGNEKRAEYIYSIYREKFSQVKRFLRPINGKATWGNAILDQFNLTQRYF